VGIIQEKTVSDSDGAVEETGTLRFPDNPKRDFLLITPLDPRSGKRRKETKREKNG